LKWSHDVDTHGNPSPPAGGRAREQVDRAPRADPSDHREPEPGEHNRSPSTTNTTLTLTRTTPISQGPPGFTVLCCAVSSIVVIDALTRLTCVEPDSETCQFESQTPELRRDLPNYNNHQSFCFVLGRRWETLSNKGKLVTVMIDETDTG
jgi:hypothetical protein